MNNLVNKIDVENFPPIINDEETGTGKRFEKVFYNTHNRIANSFLSELQFSFAVWLISADLKESDNKAFERWKFLIQSIYNAGESIIKENSELFVNIVDCLLAQFKILSKEWFSSDSFLVVYSDYLSEDMTDTGIDKLVEKAKHFKDFISKMEL